ncbi:MAG TPA: protein kinase, partial [Bryobacteraceae bacterium]
MWSFQYKHGDRPLEGFTIQRAAGRGGFGEVYYALSDSGREVALKVVQGYEQIELRGISQCMNLKSPHLVTIFDVKYNAEGRPFVIMEYVSGPSLRQLLDESPAGLGTQKTAFFLREIGKGLTFLHDCGIVHRDLKPGNIFFENGYVKIGDYGLSKAISPTQHSGQTVTVGTVHYMAPEIGAGKYDRSIDIYAMGAVLYEMLTGTVPFIGASPSEILMKHLSADPDLSGVPEPFATVIRKAMAKDPAQRYQSIQEMVEAVFGTEHVRMSVSHFSPDDLSMVAGRVAQKMAVVGAGGIGGASGSGTSGGIGVGNVGGGNLGGGNIGGGVSNESSSVVGSDDLAARMRNRLGEVQQQLQDSGERIRQNFQASAERIRNRFGEMGIGNPAGPAIPPIPDRQPTAINDPLPLLSRQFLGFLTAVVVAVAAGIIGANDGLRGSLTPIALPIFVFTAIVGASLGVIVGWRKIAIPKLQHESQSVRKLAVATVVCGMTLLLSGLFWVILIAHGRYHSGTLIAVLAPLSFINTWNWARANRKERVSLGPAIGAGFIGFILCSIFSGDPLLAIAVLAGTSLVVQVISPWDPMLAANRGWRSKDSSELETPTTNNGGFNATTPMKVYGNVNATPQQAEAMRAAGTHVYGNLNIRDTGAAGVQPLTAAYSNNLPGTQFVPRPMPYIWLGSFVILLSIGLMMLIAVGMDTIRGNDQGPFIAMGVASCVSALFCFIRVFQKRMYGWWSYLIRPVLMLLCVNSIIISAIVMGNMNRLGSDDQLAGTFFIVFPAILFLTLPFLPRTLGSTPDPNIARGTSPHARGVAFGLTWLWFCGAAGIQRFYVGKIGTGILWLVTGGLFGVGQLVDLILISTGRFTDVEGRVVRNWEFSSGNQPFIAETLPPPLPTTANPQGNDP